MSISNTKIVNVCRQSLAESIAGIGFTQDTAKRTFTLINAEFIAEFKIDGSPDDFLFLEYFNTLPLTSVREWADKKNFFEKKLRALAPSKDYKTRSMSDTEVMKLEMYRAVRMILDTLIESAKITSETTGKKKLSFRQITTFFDKLEPNATYSHEDRAVYALDILPLGHRISVYDLLAYQKEISYDPALIHPASLTL